jgi:flavin-dependent dehydrogenase
MSRQFDAIVIGSGLGGLTAGALYARAVFTGIRIHRRRRLHGRHTGRGMGGACGDSGTTALVPVR